jgi:TonB-linked SusC/RagA family outer membrane protein
MKKEKFLSNFNSKKALVIVTLLLFSVVWMGQVFSQTDNQPITIKGTVLDEKNEPIIGASIIEMGTTNGVITDFDGAFTLKTKMNATISVSYVGYVTQRIKVTTPQYKIVLKEDISQLDEIVAVGYAKVKRANVAGSVTNMNAKEVIDIPAPNLASVLAGKMAGVHVNEPTGNPLGVSTVTVRINGTFSTTDEPLYVIDGFIRDVSAFNKLDPSEIESISVLKDASAAIYGVRGANGVVLVETKKRIVGPPQVNYSSSLGISQGIKMPEMMSAYEQAVTLNDLAYQELKYSGGDVSKKDIFSDSELERLKTLNYDWAKMGWQDAINTRHTLNVSGGSEEVKYFVGGNYLFANGNFKGLHMNRFGLRFGVDVKLTKNLTGTFSMDFTQRDTKTPKNQLDTEGDRMYGTFSELIRTPRWIAPYIDGLPVYTQTGINVLELLNSGSYKTSKSQSTVSSISFKYKVPQVKGLEISFTGNYSRSANSGLEVTRPYNLYSFEKETYYPHIFSNTRVPVTDKNYIYTVENNNRISASASNSYNYQINPQISYANKFGKHNVSGFLMYEQSEGGGDGMSGQRYGVIIPYYDVMNGYSTVGQEVSSNINTKSRRQSFISRLSYIYDDKYIFEGAARYDASTNFAPGYRWGLFPSASVAWRISEEDFFKEKIEFINSMKLRASAGRLGNDKATANQWRYSYGINTNGVYIGGTSASTAVTPKNAGLVYYSSTWETTDSYNLGVDMDLFDQFFVGVDAFYKYTTDILDSPQSDFPQAAGLSGATIPKLNYGIQSAWGGELELKWNKNLTKDLNVYISVNLSYAINYVIKKYQSPGVIGTWKDEEHKTAQGEVGYTCIGLARTQEEIDKYISDLRANYQAFYNPTGEFSVSALGVTEAQMKPGMLMFKDIGSAPYRDADGNWHDGAPDGIIDENDIRIISKYSFNPFNYGFSFGFKYKQLSCDLLFDGAFGNDVLFEKGFWTDASGGGRTGAFLSANSNQLREWYGNYWTEDNPNAKYPRLDSKSLRANRSTFWMRNGHELRLKSMNISYSLPKDISKKLDISNFRVFMQASNLLTIINPFPYKDASVGFWSDYPMIRTVNLGLNVSF